MLIRKPGGQDLQENKNNEAQDRDQEARDAMDHEEQDRAETAETAREGDRRKKMKHTTAMSTKENTITWRVSSAQ